MLTPAVASLIEKLQSMLLTGDFSSTLFFLWNMNKTSRFVTMIKHAKIIFTARKTLSFVMFLSGETGTVGLVVDLFNIGIWLLWFIVYFNWFFTFSPKLKRKITVTDSKTFTYLSQIKIFIISNIVRSGFPLLLPLSSDSPPKINF